MIGNTYYLVFLDALLLRLKFSRGNLLAYHHYYLALHLQHIFFQKLTCYDVAL